MLLLQGLQLAELSALPKTLLNEAKMISRKLTEQKKVRLELYIGVKENQLKVGVFDLEKEGKIDFKAGSVRKSSLFKGLMADTSTKIDW